MVCERSCQIRICGILRVRVCCGLMTANRSSHLTCSHVLWVWVGGSFVCGNSCAYFLGRHVLRVWVSSSFVDTHNTGDVVLNKSLNSLALYITKFPIRETDQSIVSNIFVGRCSVDNFYRTYHFVVFNFRQPHLRFGHNVRIIASIVMPLHNSCLFIQCCANLIGSLVHPIDHSLKCRHITQHNCVTYAFNGSHHRFKAIHIF